MSLLVIFIFTRALAFKQGVSSMFLIISPRLEKIRKYLLEGDRLRKIVRSLFLKLFFFFTFFAGDSLKTFPSSLMNHILAQCSGTPVAEHIVFDMNRFCYFFPFFSPARARAHKILHRSLPFILSVSAVVDGCMCRSRAGGRWWLGHTLRKSTHAATSFFASGPV